MPEIPPTNLTRITRAQRKSRSPVQNGFDVSNTASRSFGSKAPRQADRDSGAERSRQEGGRTRTPGPMQTRVLDDPVAKRFDFRERGAKRDRNQAREKSDEQRSGKLSAALLVGASKKLLSSR